MICQTPPKILGLNELTRLTIYNIVDNESDGISSPCPCVKPIRGITRASKTKDKRPCVYTQEFASLIQRDGELNMEKMCNAAHGLSLLLIAEYEVHTTSDSGDDGKAEDSGDKAFSSTRETVTEYVLFDGGPDPDVWRKNTHKLGLTGLLQHIDTVVLSHYHSDHSNGLRAAVPEICQTRKERGNETPLIVDLHHKPISTRGLKSRGKIYPMTPPNPSVAELESLGAKVQLHKKGHVTCGGCFYVSGEIPRKTSFETGLTGHFTQIKDGHWVPDADILDERYIACKIRGRGTVVISACSHAGIINVCQNAKETIDSKITAVVGGFHLSGSSVEGRIEATIQSLEELNPDVLLAGHCTGWKAKAALVKTFEFTFQPLAVGGKYVFNSM